MKKTLRELYREHEGKFSDKWSLYLNEFEALFAPYRDRSIALLEIGIQNGGSLEIWDRYFPNARKIIGCDIDPKCAELRYDSPRIAVVIGDANTETIEGEILGHAPALDILIDDGSHRSGDIVRSFARYFPHLNDGGVYVAEDLHASYWNDFEGGLHSPLSAMSFFKRLTDIINHEHWRNSETPRGLVARFGEEFGIDFQTFDFSLIHSLEFLNSICVIRKMPSEHNMLGERVIAGRDELLTSGTKQFDGADIHNFGAAIKDERELDVFELLARRDALLQSVQTLEAQVAEQAQRLTEKERSVQELNARLDQSLSELEGLRAEVLRYSLSRSWRFTRPARKVLQWITGRRNVVS